MIVPKGMSCGFGRKRFKAGDIIPPVLEFKFAKQIERGEKRLAALKNKPQKAQEKNNEQDFFTSDKKEDKK